MSARRGAINLHELQKANLMEDFEEERRAEGRPPARTQAACRTTGPGGCRPGQRENVRENFSGPQAPAARGAPPGCGFPRTDTGWRGVQSAARAPIAPRITLVPRVPGAREAFGGSRSESSAPQGDWGEYEEEPTAEPGKRPGSSAPPRANGHWDGIDIHELLKREAFETPIPGCDDHFEKNRPCPSGVYGVSDQYIVLDTFHKLQMSDIERGTFQWNFMVQGVTGDEVLGVRDKMSTVIAIQLGPFSMPILPEVPYVLNAVAAPTGTDQLELRKNNNSNPANYPHTDAPLLFNTQYPQGIANFAPPAAIYPWVNNPYTQFPSYGRFTIQLKEAGLQSYSDGKGARHHYDYTLSTTANSGGTNPNMLAAVPQAGAWWDTFIFTDPLEAVHGITLVFRNPDAPIRFLPDCLYDVSIEADAAAFPGPYLRVRAPGFDLNWGDRIVIRGFSSGNSKLDSYVNRDDGHVAAGDPNAAAATPGDAIDVVGDPDVFYTDPAVGIGDLTVMPPALPQVVDVCIAKRRMRIPARFRTVVARLTQYVAP